MSSNNSFEYSAPQNGNVVDPVLPDQGGRNMSSDPGHVLPGSEEDLRRLAYERYEARGRKDGKALEDWLAAESARSR